MELSLSAAALLGLLLAGWSFTAAVLILRARDRARQARNARAMGRRLAKMIEQSPAIPLLVKGDGALEGPERLAAWLGLERLPGFLSELRATQGGLADADLKQLQQAVRRTQRTAAPFHMQVTLPGSQRSIALWGQHADQLVGPRGSALVWWIDNTEAKVELTRLQAEADEARRDFSAIGGLIEAAPMPMWVRGPDLELRLVNSAYVAAVAAEDSDTVLEQQIELIEVVDGRTAAQVAGEARDSRAPVERLVQATIDGQRRAIRVRDLPLVEGEIGGFAIDVQDQEAYSREIGALREAQRATLDLLSVGVAQFDYERHFVFANQPFQHVFRVRAPGAGETMDFRDFLERARDRGRLPETGNFPAWRQEVSGWFGGEEPVEQAWSLSDGTHLRVVGLPMPDGGLVLIAEDRSQQLAFSATRDTLLRTRAVILDCLPEAVAIFAPDSRLQSWNRRFPELWDLSADYLDERPRAEDLLEKVEQKLGPEDGAASMREIVRAATLDRERRGEVIRMADGRTLELAGLPLPDGNGLLVMREVAGPGLAEAAAPRGKEVKPAPAEAAPAGSPADEDAEAPQIELEVPPDRASLDLTEVELLPFVIGLVREREAAIEAKYITCDLRGDRRSGKVEADRQHLARAIGILVDRAIAISPAGGKIEVVLSPRREKARIAVSDKSPLREDGGGAPEASADVEIARSLIEVHGGQLDLASAPGGGTNATIILP